MQVQKYNFGQEFQDQIVTLLLLDKGFVNDYLDVLSPQYFEYPDAGATAKIFLDYVTHYHTHPDYEAMRALISESCRTSVRVDPQREQRLHLYLWQRYQGNLENTQFIRDKIVPFGRAQNMKIAIQTVVPMVESIDERESDISRILNEALMSGTGNHRNIDSLKDSWANFPNELIEHLSDDSSQRLATGIPKLDRHLKGGLGLKEIGFIEALPGVGKSNLLINFAATALYQGKYILFITNELHVMDVKQRLASRITGIPIDHIHLPEHREVYNQYMSGALVGNMFTSYHKPHSLTALGLRTAIAKIENTIGKRVDMVLLDYFNRMGGIDPRNPWNSESYMVKEVIGVLADYETRMWTATQPNTLNTDIQYLDMSHSGGSKAKSQDADIFMSLNQSSTDFADSKANIYISKARRGEPNQAIPVFYDKAKCTILDWDDYYTAVMAGQQ